MQLSLKVASPSRPLKTTKRILSSLAFMIWKNIYSVVASKLEKNGFNHYFDLLLVLLKVANSCSHLQFLKIQDMDWINIQV